MSNYDGVFRFFPVFFNRDILDEFKKKPYQIKWITKYLGTVWKGDKWIITFGISPKGFIHVWLGDLLDKIETEDDALPFVKHAFQPDRLGKHFFKTQIYAEFATDKDEN